MITGTETAHLVARGAPVVVDPRLPIVEAQDVVLLGLREDQRVRLTVEVRGEGLRLLLYGRPLLLPSGFPLVAGEGYIATVRLLPNGTAQLRPLQASATPAGAGKATVQSDAAPDAVLSPRLERLLWRPPGLGALIELLRPSALQSLLSPALAASPEGMRQLGQWASTQPRMSMLSGAQLREAILRSGFFTEAALTRPPESMAPDLKAVLRDLVRQMQAPGGDAVQALAEAIDDIEAAQLRALESNSSGQGVLQLALGFVDAPPVRIELRNGRKGERAEDGVWHVDLHTQGERWGEVWLASRIEAGKRIDMTMWAVRADICRLAAEKMPDLAAALQSWQLSLSGLRIVHGTRPARDSAIDAGDAGHVVDLQA